MNGRVPPPPRGGAPRPFSRHPNEGGPPGPGQFQWLGRSSYPSSIDRGGSSMPGGVGPSWPLAATANEMPTTPMRAYQEVSAQPSSYPWPGASPYQQQMPPSAASPYQLMSASSSPYQLSASSSPYQLLSASSSPYQKLPPSAATLPRSVYSQFATTQTIPQSATPVSPHAGGALSAQAIPYHPHAGPHDGTHLCQHAFSQGYPHEVGIPGSHSYGDNTELKQKSEHVIPQAISKISHGLQLRDPLADDLIHGSDVLDDRNLLHQALGEAVEQRLSPLHKHNTLQHHYQEDQHRQAGVTPNINSKHKSEQSLPQVSSRGYQKQQSQVPLVSLDLPKVIQLSQYKENHPLTGKLKMYDGTLEPVCSSDGRYCIHSYMDDMFGKHDKGFSWGGNFSKEDLVWDPNNGRFFINKKPELPTTPDNVLKDTYRLGEDLLENFGKGDPSEQPHYMAHLHDMMTDPPVAVRKSESAMKKYIVFIRAHPAFALPMSRLQLLIGMFCVYDAADSTERKSLRRVINFWCRGKTDWRNKVGLHPFLSKRFHHKDVVEPTKGDTNSEVKNEDPAKGDSNNDKEVENEDPTKGVVKSRYFDKAVSFLEFLRHCGVHGYEATRIRDETGDKQLMESFEEIDILLALFFPFFIADLVYCFVQNHDNFKRFESVWNSYAKVELKELQLVPKCCKTVCTS